MKNFLYYFVFAIKEDAGFNVMSFLSRSISLQVVEFLAVSLQCTKVNYQ